MSKTPYQYINLVGRNLKSGIDKLNETKCEKLNAKEYGFVNDGATDNSSKMTAFIESGVSKVLYFPDGVYCFSQTIDFTDNMYLELSKGATLKYIGVQTDYFIRLNYHKIPSGNYDSYIKRNYINGGTINCNDLCNTAIGMVFNRNVKFNDVAIENFIVAGIETRMTPETTSSGAFGGATEMYSCRFYNETPRENCTAILDNGNDNTFSDIIVHNVPIAVDTHNGQFRNIHHWVDRLFDAISTTFAIVRNRGGLFSGCILDTINIGYAPTSYAHFTAIGTWMYWNTKYWEYKTDKSGCFIKNESNLSKFAITNSYIKYLDGFTFMSNITPSYDYLTVTANIVVPSDGVQENAANLYDSYLCMKASKSISMNGNGIYGVSYLTFKNAVQIANDDDGKGLSLYETKEGLESTLVTLHSVEEPTADNDAANKKYVDSVVEKATEVITSEDGNYRILKNGKVCVLTLVGGSATADLNSGDTYLTIPYQYRPAGHIDFKDTYSGKRCLLTTGGVIMVREAVAKGTMLLGSITYLLP